MNVNAGTLSGAASGGADTAKGHRQAGCGPQFVATPVDSATEEISGHQHANKNLIQLNHAKYGDLARDEFVPQLSRTGKTWLYDGRTGEKTASRSRSARPTS